MIEPHWQALAVGASQIEIHHCRFAFAGLDFQRIEQRHAVAQHQAFHIHSAGFELGEIQTEPVRQGRVDIHD